MRSKEDIVKEKEYIALDQDLCVFAGYKEGYPFWSVDMDDAKPINNNRHLNTLRCWFPNKQIEAIEI
jgi:hypothetical protein